MHDVKHVHFARQNTFHPPPPTNLPAPYIRPITRDYHGPAFFSRDSGTVRLHHYLEMSAVTWDLMDYPSMITRNHRSISSRTFRESATNPPLGFMTIAIQCPPWRIQVYSSSCSYITLEDIFRAVYLFLRTNITISEFKALSSENDRLRATRAYERRYRRQRSSRIFEEEKYGGMKRVDFLMEHSSFLGISTMEGRFALSFSSQRA